MRYEVWVVDPAHPTLQRVVMSDHCRSLDVAARAVVGGDPGVVSTVSVSRSSRVPNRQIARFEKLAGGLVRVKTELLRSAMDVEPQNVCPVAGLRMPL